MYEHDCKGSHLVLARKWFDENMGPGSLDRLTGSDAYPAVVLPGAWYGIAPLARACEEASKKLGRPVHQLVAEIAKQNALQDLTTMYQVFLRVASPVRFLTFTPTLWRNYVRFADAEVRRNEPGDYLGLCTNVPAPYVEWAMGGWLGFLPPAIELAGGKGATATIQNKRATRGEMWAFECVIKYGKK